MFDRLPTVLFATVVSICVRPTSRSLAETERRFYGAARRCVREAQRTPANRERLLNTAATLLACRRLVLAFLEP
jgi:hypothetical protein